MAEPRLIFLNRVYRPSTAATAQLLTDLAESLAARGWPVHVIASGEDSGPHHGVTIHRTGPGDQHGGMLSRAMNYRRFQRSALRLLRGLVRPGDLVVPMTDPPLLGRAVTPTAVAGGAHVIPWIQDIYPEIATVHFGLPGRLALAGLKSSRDSAWLTARACVTLGEEMASILTGRGVPRERITLIPNWAPRELATPASPAEITARRSRWEVAGKFVVAYSGNLGRVHEFDTVLAAAEQLRHDPAVCFLFIGQGARFEAIRTAARDRNLGHIRLLPPEPRESLAVALAAADAHLVTLRPEYAPLVYPSKLAGVLAAGRPVLFVGPPQGEIARLLEREECGAAFSPGEGRRLAGTISRWQADPALVAGLGDKARALYARDFTAAGAVSRWEELLRRVRPGP